jgi:hypothetical protein
MIRTVLTHVRPPTTHRSPFPPILPLFQTNTPTHTILKVTSTYLTRTAPIPSKIRTRVLTRKEQDRDLSVPTLLEGLGMETTSSQIITRVQDTLPTLTRTRTELSRLRGRLLRRICMRHISLPLCRRRTRRQRRNQVPRKGGDSMKTAHRRTMSTSPGPPVLISQSRDLVCPPACSVLYFSPLGFSKSQKRVLFYGGRLMTRVLGCSVVCCEISLFSAPSFLLPHL